MCISIIDLSTVRVGALLFGIILLISFSSNPPQRATGAPGEGGCDNSGCHSGGATINGEILIKGIEEQISPNESYALTLQLVKLQGSPIRGGFQMVILDSSNSNFGNLINSDDNSTISTTAGRQYFEHQPAQFFAGKDTIEYKVTWEAGNYNTEDIMTIYTAANFANGNNSVSGDRIVFKKIEIPLKLNNTRIESQINHPNCQFSDDGSLSVEILEGTPPYSFLWSTGDTTNRIGMLSSGNYSVTVNDSNENTLTESYELEGPIDIEAPIMTCISDIINIGSCQPFSYLLPTSTDNCSESDIRLISGIGTNKSFPIGTTLEIYEARDLSGNTSRCTITINNQPQVDINIEIQDIACFNDLFGSASIEIEGDNDPYQIVLDEGTETLDELSEGNHIIKVIDAGGCEYNRSFMVHRPDSLYFESITVINASSGEAGNGKIIPVIRGGTPPYKYVWITEDELFSTEEELTLLFPGKYLLEVTDFNNCLITTDTILVDITSSINEINLLKQFTFLQTPIHEHLQINYRGQIPLRELKLYDLNGKLISRNINLRNKTKLYFSDKPAGMYIIQIRLMNDDMIVQKVIKI